MKAAPSEQNATGIRLQATGIRQQASGNWKQATGMEAAPSSEQHANLYHASDTLLANTTHTRERHTDSLPCFACFASGNHASSALLANTAHTLACNTRVSPSRANQQNTDPVQVRDLISHDVADPLHACENSQHAGNMLCPSGSEDSDDSGGFHNDPGSISELADLEHASSQDLLTSSADQLATGEPLCSVGNQEMDRSRALFSARSGGFCKLDLADSHFEPMSTFGYSAAQKLLVSTDGLPCYPV